jgi:hypothetical protein
MSVTSRNSQQRNLHLRINCCDKFICRKAAITLVVNQLTARSCDVGNGVGVMKATVIRTVGGRIITKVYEVAALVPAMRDLGFDVAGVVDEPYMERYLLGLPRFEGLIGPIGDGANVRYEDIDANEIFFASGHPG